MINCITVCGVEHLTVSLVRCGWLVTQLIARLLLFLFVICLYLGLVLFLLSRVAGKCYWPD